MNPDHWRRVRDLLDAALQKTDGHERFDYLEQIDDDPKVVRDARSLLVAIEQADTFIEEPAPAAFGLQPLGEPTRAEGADANPDEAPERIGVYEIENLLGEGGMGSVYLATRDDETFRKQVAVKVLKLGMDTRDIVRRFHSERQILADLPHPNIAQIVDGGSTEDGRPFLVMEYVDGEPIDEYCRRRQLGVRDRVELFSRVCRAVQFAHQNLVIHRDLKPANVLVTDDGVPKLLDFGIAKLLRPEGFPRTVAQTAAGTAFMTPEYASPEQVLGQNVTTVCDVYSLGVMLFELLTGQRPYGSQRGTEALLQAMQDVEPERPSSVAGKIGDPDRARRLRRRLVGDLDNIILKALQKDPQRRYGSAEQLAEDLDRYLDGRPVRARPDTFGYRASKLMRRHKAAVAVGALLLALAVAFTTALFFEQRRTLDQRDRAELVSEILTEVFALPDPVRSRGETITALEILNRGTKHIEAKIAERPEIRGDLGLTLGRTYKNLGLYPEALEHLEAAVEALRLEGSRPERLADALDELAQIRGLSGHPKTAEAPGREALELRSSRLGHTHPAVIRSRVHLAELAEQSGEYERSREMFEQTLATARESQDPETVALVLDRYGQLLIATGEESRAARRFQEALELYRGLDESHPEVPTTMGNLALAIGKEEPARAEDLLRSALAVQRDKFREGRPSLADNLENLAHHMDQQGRYEEAEPLYQETLDLQRQIYGPDHPKMARTLNKLAWMRAKTGDPEGAEELFRRVLDIQRPTLGDDHAETAYTLSNLGQLLLRLGRLDEAETLLKQALETTDRALGSHHPRVGIVTVGLADLAQARGRSQEADHLLNRAIGILRAARSPELLGALNQQARRLLSQKKNGQAQKSYAEALAVAEATLGETHPDTAKMAAALARVENQLGRHAEAEALARRAYDILVHTLSADDGWTATARRAWIESLLKQKRFDDAEPLLLTDFERLRRDQGLDASSTQDVLGRLIQLYESWDRASEANRYRKMETQP